MTIDKAIRYPVRKKYRGGGYDAGAGGGTASGYNGGAFGGNNTSGGNGGNNTNNYNSISSYTAGATQAQLDSIQKGIADKQQVAADKVAADNKAINTGLTSLYGLGEGFDLSGYNTDATTTSLNDINAAMADITQRKKSVADRIKESTLNAFNNPMETATNLTLGGLSNAYKGLSLNPGFAGAKLLGNMFNFNPTLDEDGNIKSGIFGPENASLYNRLDVDQYDNPENIDVQDFMRAAFTFDEDGNYVSKANDYDKLKAYTNSVGATYTGSTAEDLAAQRVADREGNRGQINNISQSSSSGGTGGDTGGGDTSGDDTSGDDTSGDDSTTNNKTYTSEQERTMAYLGEMGYNRRYQEDYIDKDGVLFNFDEYDDIDFVS